MGIYELINQNEPRLIYQNPVLTRTKGWLKLHTSTKTHLNLLLPIVVKIIIIVLFSKKRPLLHKMSSTETNTQKTPKWCVAGNMSMVSSRLAIHVIVLLLLLLIQIFFQILTTSSKSSYLTPFPYLFTCLFMSMLSNKIKFTIDFYNDEQLRIILEYLREIKRRERQVYYKIWIL
jgi:hypothetical protein